MSTLDRVISCLHRNIDEIQRAMAELEVVKSQMEEVAGQFEAVGMEGNSAVAAATIDWVEQTQGQLQEALAQVEAQIPVAQALKTGGSFAAAARGETPSAGGSESKPGPVATTGADPTPNPVHATPPTPANHQEKSATQSNRHMRSLVMAMTHVRDGDDSAGSFIIKLKI